MKILAFILPLALTGCITHSLLATTVTGTVTGADGTVYAGGTYTATLVNAAGSPLYVAPGTTTVTQKFASGALDVAGAFTVTLVDNATLSAGSQWKFYVCSSGSQFDVTTKPACFTSPITITGSSQSVSSTLSAAAPAQTIKLPSVMLPVDPTQSLQAATKHYVDTHGGAGGADTWGAIVGALTDQADLVAALAAKDASGAAAAATASAAQKSANLSDLANAATARGNLGLGTAATHLTTDYDASGAAAAATATAAQRASNLSDIASATTARNNLGLGAAAQLALSTTIANPGVDTLLPTEKAVRTLFGTLVGGSGITTGTLAARASTCAPGDLYSTTDNTTSNPGRAISYCPQGGTSWAFQGSIDGSGLKYNSSGDLGLDLAKVPRLDTDNTFAGNLTILGTCTGCGLADNGTEIDDTNGNPTVVSGGATTGAVNFIAVTNAATGNGPTLTGTGSDSSVDLNLNTKAFGSVKIGDGSGLWWAFKVDTDTGRRFFTSASNVFQFDTDGHVLAVDLTLTGGSEPTCNSGNRMKFWTVPGGTGVADKVEVCTKDVSDAYAWHLLY